MESKEEREIVKLERRRKIEGEWEWECEERKKSEK